MWTAKRSSWASTPTSRRSSWRGGQCLRWRIRRQVGTGHLPRPASPCHLSPTSLFTSRFGRVLMMSGKTTDRNRPTRGAFVAPAGPYSHVQSLEWLHVSHLARWCQQTTGECSRVSRRLKPASDQRMSSGRLHGAFRPTGFLAATPQKEALAAPWRWPVLKRRMTTITASHPQILSLEVVLLKEGQVTDRPPPSHREETGYSLASRRCR